MDVDHSTFLIGALPEDSYLLTSDINGSPILAFSSTVNLRSVANTVWLENLLNYTNSSYYGVTSSEGDQFEYLVPCPPRYTSTMKAYWTTDVIVLEPSCSWSIGVNSNGVASIPLFNLSFLLEKYDLGMFKMFLLPSNFFMCLLDFSINPYDANFSLDGLSTQWRLL